MCPRNTSLTSPCCSFMLANPLRLVFEHHSREIGLNGHILKFISSLGPADKRKNTEKPLFTSRKRWRATVWTRERRCCSVPYEKCYNCPFSPPRRGRLILLFCLSFPLHRKICLLVFHYVSVSLCFWIQLGCFLFAPSNNVTYLLLWQVVYVHVRVKASAKANLNVNARVMSVETWIKSSG